MSDITDRIADVIRQHASGVALATDWPERVAAAVVEELGLAKEFQLGATNPMNGTTSVAATRFVTEWTDTRR
jgi:hypothetical protein